MSRFWKWLLGLAQKRCTHPADAVKADLLEGHCKNGMRVEWCKVCGAVHVVCRCNLPQKALRRPRPDWH